MPEPLIVVVSNRNVNPDQTNHELFGEEHNAGGWDQLRIAKAAYTSGQWQLELIDDDQGQNPPPSKKLFDEIIRKIRDGTISNRFVFFIHGNNQTFKKNLNKSRKLAVLHNVNVIAFSWPSRPAGGTVKSRFRQAQRNALRTALALENGLNKLAEYMASCGLHVELNLLVHSLGNLVIKSFTEALLPSVRSGMFRRVVLHQGSPPNRNHHTWLDQIDISQEVYMTINRRDGVLHHAETIDPPTMGKTRKNLIADDAIYIDFTGGEHVGNKHELFGIEDGYVHEVIQNILVGLNPELEQDFRYDEDENVWVVRAPRAREMDVAKADLLSDKNPDYNRDFDDPEDQTISGAYLGM